MAKIFYNAISVTSKGFEVVKNWNHPDNTGYGQTYGLRKDVPVKVEAVEVASKGLKVAQIGTTSGST